MPSFYFCSSLTDLVCKHVDVWSLGWEVLIKSLTSLTSVHHRPPNRCPTVNRFTDTAGLTVLQLQRLQEKSLEISCKTYLQSCREALGVCKDVFVHNKIWLTQNAVVKEEVDGQACNPPCKNFGLD